jgi:hypothetical protein
MKIIKGQIPIVPILSLLLALAGNFMGCETEDWSFKVDCDECYGYAPDSANLIIYLTINQENPAVPITLYKGSLEAGIVDWRDTATTSEYRLFSAVDEDYTVKAEYKSGNKTIIAYDGDQMFLYDAGDECGSPCYIVKGGIFDNRLAD